ncbi:pseudouridine-5'-phosphate glycosidase [Dongia deserti]|uniref:pseudouridine-5'-phosphate glycosidase n=1 Tax=Dongia deserti TaxID=2268030 RepID=UPI000E649EE7|nr:pseudouridine-5'-phosphate glycosidase [Dongia deserti]
MRHPDLDIAPEIAEALAQGGAVVALESTIIAHGMPYPGNLVTARALERMIRTEGAVPATIAVLGGRLKVGLDDAALEQLAQSPDMAKASVRDLPVLIAQRRDGATTVAATMRIAAMAGIRVFATGGIGGVHRGAELSGDVSADLTELAQSPVAVISAGAKAILDLPRTLEMLETLSVPVIGYRCDEFPAFYSRTSGLCIPVRADSPEDIAVILAAHWRLSNEGGALIANPIPSAEEIPAGKIEGHIATALREARARGIAGKDVTPFLLAHIRDLTEGESQRANVALALNNAQLGAKIACALSTSIKRSM